MKKKSIKLNQEQWSSLPKPLSCKLCHLHCLPLATLPTSLLLPFLFHTNWTAIIDQAQIKQRAHEWQWLDKIVCFSFKVLCSRPKSTQLGQSKPMGSNLLCYIFLFIASSEAESHLLSVNVWKNEVWYLGRKSPCLLRGSNGAPPCFNPTPRLQNSTNIKWDWQK